MLKCLLKFSNLRLEELGGKLVNMDVLASMFSKAIKHVQGKGYPFFEQL
jgi:hypothetical protein